MRQEFLKRFCIGMPVGVTIGFVIGLFFSFGNSSGEYFPVPPEMFDAWSTENMAVLVSGLLCALLGGSFSGFSIFWDKDDWSLLTKTVAYYFVNLVVISLIGYLCYWFPRNNVGAYISFFVIYSVIFICIWLVSYLLERRNVQQLNSKIVGN